MSCMVYDGMSTDRSKPSRGSARRSLSNTDSLPAKHCDPLFLRIFIQQPFKSKITEVHYDLDLQIVFRDRVMFNTHSSVS